MCLLSGGQRRLRYTKELRFSLGRSRRLIRSPMNCISFSHPSLVDEFRRQTDILVLLDVEH
ncbi:Molybdopterin-guanine dinucleotide biosynthesis protein A [Geobacillus sp. WSUCF1]|nr:Molybdopterin-guanine dinucleotide biosynthesis protein A [Geobacillus sp. WSUCF1]